MVIPRPPLSISTLIIPILGTCIGVLITTHRHGHGHGGIHITILGGPITIRGAMVLRSVGVGIGAPHGVGIGIAVLPIVGIGAGIMDADGCLPITITDRHGMTSLTISPCVGPGPELQALPDVPDIPAETTEVVVPRELIPASAAAAAVVPPAQWQAVHQAVDVLPMIIPQRAKQVAPPESTIPLMRQDL